MKEQKEYYDYSMSTLALRTLVKTLHNHLLHGRKDKAMKTIDRIDEEVKLMKEKL